MAKSEMYLEAAGREVRISSPDKVMFPEQGWTKLDVARHYLYCAEGVTRAMAGRPTLLKRWPKGINHEPFYQKRASTNARETAEIRFPSARPGKMLIPRDVSDIIDMVQLNCLDLHPWPVRTPDLDHPDELRVDLDPSEGSSFEEARAVASVVRQVLEENGLTSWPKTSGSRGIHIYARLEPKWTFNEVRRGVLALSREVERREPELSTTAWWKEERSGVFLDYNQNARDKTVASAYSVRHTGMISTPFRWDELETIGPAAYTLGNFAERWDAVGDLEEGMDAAAGSLDGLLEMVAKDEAQGIGDAPWPPHYPKQPGEPPRVQPSKRKMEG
jgi:bifunctional non-homologous end joining protein LigD